MRTSVANPLLFNSTKSLVCIRQVPVIILLLIIIVNAHDVGILESL